MKRENKLRYIQVREDVFRPVHGSNFSCSKDKWILKELTFVSNEHTHKTENTWPQGYKTLFYAERN